MAPKEPGEFVNTWSVDGFVGEGCQPAELGWGSHEKNWPRDGKKHDFGRGSAIYLMQPGAGDARAHVDAAGRAFPRLPDHARRIDLDLRLPDRAQGRPGRSTGRRCTTPITRATSRCCRCMSSQGNNWRMQDRKRIMMDEIMKGIDELGVLLAGHKKNAYWYGSQLSVQEARQLAPHNSATSLQVTVAVLAGMVWAIENPNSGMVEPDEMDYKRVLEICRPYLGQVVGEYSEWHPLVDRGRLFPEDLDETDPWQFKNVRVI